MTAGRVAVTAVIAVVVAVGVLGATAGAPASDRLVALGILLAWLAAATGLLRWLQARDERRAAECARRHPAGGDR